MRQKRVRYNTGFFGMPARSGWAALHHFRAIHRYSVFDIPRRASLCPRGTDAPGKIHFTLKRCSIVPQPPPKARVDRLASPAASARTINISTVFYYVVLIRFYRHTCRGELRARLNRIVSVSSLLKAPGTRHLTQLSREKKNTQGGNECPPCK